jgi:uncharacterized protein (DUF934 family)
MRQVIENRKIVGDDWVYADKDRAPSGGRTVLPLADYVAARVAGQVDAATLGVKLAPVDDEESLKPYLADLPLVAVEFPNTGEGRGYTQARLLRERLGYRGELRAIGAVRVDQIWFLARCGFDVFDLASGEDPALAIAQLDRFSVVYQPGPDGLTQPRRRYGA